LALLIELKQEFALVRLYVRKNKSKKEKRIKTKNKKYLREEIDLEFDLLHQ
jgi:hypothetical protein